MIRLFEYLRDRQFEQQIFEGNGSKSKNINKMLETINKLDDEEPVILYTMIPNDCLKNKADNDWGKIIKHYGALKDVEDEMWGQAIKKYNDDVIDKLDTDGKFVNTDFLREVTDDMIVDNKVVDYSGGDDEKMFARYKRMDDAVKKYPSTVCMWGKLDTKLGGLQGIMGENTYIIHYNAKAKELLSKYLKEAEDIENFKKQKAEEDKKASEWNDDNLID